MREEISKTFDVLNKQNWENNKKAKLALKKQGIKFISPNKKDRAEMQQLADKTTKKLIKQGVFTAKMVNKVDQLLTDYRKKH